ncbi:MAG: sugar phosphate isomerase/epimerase [Pirellulales bacterium]|nr:sugar phosphate isomerase/epimerase [Pirellulales bacterium]
MNTQQKIQNRPDRELKLGLMVTLSEHVLAELEKVARLGLETCQMQCWAPHILTADLAEQAVQAQERTGVQVSSFWAGHSGANVWNFAEGPQTIGLVPLDTRTGRIEELKRGADFASAIGAPSITTHVGFIPENSADKAYPPLVDAIRQVASYCAELGLGFDFETGQETPVTLLRTIHSVGTGNLGVNLDPANLILYGKANPVDALEVLGPYVRGVHAKDGLYPTDGDSLGREVPLGEGLVDFPLLIGRLKGRFHYRNPVTIEREIEGQQQIADIRRAVELLEPLL